ncbi:MAG: hypothetical protein DRP01_00865 [Archaeoglobales archaeon]|nr:MAG: hypothetical protein DRP01_00865 [Archaeoglobales archaeon]
MRFQEIETYNPRSKRTDVLKDDYRWCFAYYASKKMGRRLRISYKQIIDLASKIAEELHRRGIEFHPERYNEHGKELFRKIARRLARKGIILKALDGLYLVEPHAKLIWKGMKTLIVKARRYENLLFYPMYLCGDKVYGIITLTGVTEVDENGFQNLKKHHLVTDKEAREWWGDRNRYYVYKFSFKRFDKPKEYVRPQGAQVKIDDVQIKKMKKPFSHPLGKDRQVSIFLENLPSHKVYVEPFAGGASLFWRKEPVAKEVLNDIDERYVFLLKFLKNASDEQLEKLKNMDYMPSEEKFERLKKTNPDDDVERAYKLIYLIIHSYGGNMEDYAHRKKLRKCGYITNPEDYRERLKNTIITNKDFEEVMKEYDSPDTFFYLDPPYMDEDIKEDPEAFKRRLFEACKKLKGKFLLSFSDDPLIKKLFKDAGFEVKSFLAKRPLSKDYPIKRELLIANYPIKIPKLKKSDVMLKFLGTRGYVEEKSELHNKRASLLIDDGKTKLLIDWGDVNGELPDCDAIIITHAHPDHLFGLKNKEIDVPVFITDATTHSEYYREGVYKFSKTVFKRRSAFRVGDIEVISVPVLHSTKAPNIALFINVGGYRICYASDVLNIRKKHRDKFLRGCDLYIGDGSTLREDGLVRWDEKRDEAIGHAGIPRQIKWCEEAGVKRMIFTHFGSEPIKLGRKLEEKLAELGAEMAYDGWVTNVLVSKAVNLEEIDDEYVEKLSDKKLRELYEELHEIYEREGRITEPLLNAEIFVENEMKRRGMERNINDKLSQEASFWVQEYPPWEKEKKITLQEVIDSFPDVIKIPADVPAIYIVGGLANRGWVTHHDIDIRVASDKYLPEVKRALIHACTRNDIREKLQFIFDSRGGIGLSIPLYVPAEDGLKKDEELRLGKPSQPQKPATGWQKNEFWKIEDAWTKWGASRIDRGIMEQPKYDGMSFQWHIKDGKVIGVFTEDQLRNRIDAFKESVAELPKLLRAKDAILVAEMVEYSDEVAYPQYEKMWMKYKQIPREDLVKWIAARPSSLDDKRVIFHVHDLLYLDGEKWYDKPAIERYEKLKEVLKEGKHFHVVESKTAHNMREFFEYANWARYFPNSEGAVFKTTDSIYKIRYDRASRNKDWCLTGGSYVLTENGFERVAYLKPGVLVFAKDGELHRVLRIARRKIEPHEQLFEVKDYHGLTVRLTSEHEVLTRECGWQECSASFGLTPVFPRLKIPKEKPPEELCLSWHGYEKIIKCTKEFWKLVGFWVAEGSLGNNRNKNYRRGEFEFSQKDDQIFSELADLADRILKAKGKRYCYDGVNRYIVWDKPFCDWLSKNFLDKNDDKTLPWFIAYLDDEKFEAFWEGLWLGDRKAPDRDAISTSDNSLAGRLFAILNVRGEEVGIHKQRTNRKDNFTITRLKRPTHKILVKRLSTDHQDLVYDIEVENEDSFLTGNLVLHNSKLKNLKELDVMVLKPHLVEGTKDVFTWQGVVGPIPEKDLDKYRERDIMEFKGKKYLRIGTCYNVKGKKPEGSILTVMPIRIEKNTTEDGKIYYTWMFPKAGLWRPEKKEPDPIDVVEKLSKLGTRPFEKAGNEKVIKIELPLCPEKYAFNEEICPLINRVKILVDGVWKSDKPKVKLKVQELKYPIDCKLANYYRCRRVKPYYYGWREE